MHNTTRGSLKLSNACDVYTIAVQIKKIGNHTDMKHKQD